MSPQMLRFWVACFLLRVSAGQESKDLAYLIWQTLISATKRSDPTARLTLKDGLVQENPPPGTSSPVNIVDPGNRPPGTEECGLLSQLDSVRFDIDDTVFFWFRNLAEI